MLLFSQPLSAFMNGVESIKSSVESVLTMREEFYKAREIVPVDVSVVSNQIIENLRNLVNTNDFMLMTINRCIDYTKVWFVATTVTFVPTCLTTVVHSFRQARA